MSPWPLQVPPPEGTLQSAISRGEAAGLRGEDPEEDWLATLHSTINECEAAGFRGADLEEARRTWAEEARKKEVKRALGVHVPQSEYSERVWGLLKKRESVCDEAPGGEEKEAAEPLEWNYVLGPAFVTAKYACALVWVSVFSLSVVAGMTAECRTSGSVEGVSYNKSILVPAACVALFNCYLERTALQYALIPFLQERRRLTVMCISVGYWFWFLAGMSMSFMNVISYHTYTFFVADTLNAEFCPKFKCQLQVMKEFSPRTLTGWVSRVSPATVAIICWLMSCLRLVTAALRTLQPRYYEGKRVKVPDMTETSVAFEPYSEKDKTGGEVRFITYAKKLGMDAWKATFGEALMTLVDVCGWSSIKDMTFSYPVSQLERIERGRKEGWEKRVVSRAKIILLQGFRRTIFTACFTHASQVCIQVIGFVLRRSMMGEDKTIDWISLLSIFLTFATALSTQWDVAYTCARIGASVLHKTSARAQEVQEEKDRKDSSDACECCPECTEKKCKVVTCTEKRYKWKVVERDRMWRPKFKAGEPIEKDCQSQFCKKHREEYDIFPKERSTLHMRCWVVIAGSAVFTVAFLYALLSFVAGFECKDALWTFHEGCLALPWEAKERLQQCST